jgi:iron-sulfur cluster assembly accessory protein
MVTLTENALKKVQEFVKADASLSGKMLRVYVEAGGCSGFQYGLTFDEQRPGDEVGEFNGVKVLIDPNSSQYLKDAQVDYVEGLHGSGFSISNPQAKSSCGCGKSFQA